MKTQSQGQRNHDQSLEKLTQEVYLSLFRTHEALLFEFKLLLKEHGTGRVSEVSSASRTSASRSSCPNTLSSQSTEMTGSVSEVSSASRALKSS